MNYTVEKKYLVLPVSSHAKVKNLCFYEADKCVFDLDIKLDFVSGERDVYIDMERFLGRTLEVSVSPEMRLDLKQKERKPLERFKQKLRPKYHFTAPEGWINDPNGLVFADGVYHLFYQLNPYNTTRGNMHWGHAVSKNLFDWEHLPIALFPDRKGTMFSGGAFADKDNLLGRKYSGKTPIVLYYTAAGGTNTASKGEPFTQCMAISSDGGETFAKYDGNPIIPHIESENRDPKIVYSEKLGLFVMSLYLEDDRYLILTSKDLKSWERACNVRLHGDNECPAFFPLKNTVGVEKWILMGAHGRYLVGEFDGRNFEAESEMSHILCYTETTSFAAQKFENTGERCIRFSRLKSNFAPCGVLFNGSMSVPQELTLVTTADGDRLYINPAKETDKLHTKKVKYSKIGCEHKSELSGIAQDISITVDRKAASGAEMTLFGMKFNVDFDAGIFSCNNCRMKIAPGNDGKLRIRLLTDTCGIEVYLSGGAAYGVFTDIPDANLSLLTFASDSETGFKFEAARMRQARKCDRRK